MAIVKHNSSKSARYEDVLEYYTCRHREDSRTGHYELILDEYGLMQTRSNCAALYLTADGTEAAPERWASACRRTRMDCDQSALEAALDEWRKLQMLQTSIRAIHYTAERGKARRPERDSGKGHIFRGSRRHLSKCRLLLQEYRAACHANFFEKSRKKYQAKNVKRINDARKELYRNYRLALHVENDAEVIEQLDKKENVTGYIRQLVLRDMKTDAAKE